MDSRVNLSRPATPIVRPRLTWVHLGVGDGNRRSLPSPGPMATPPPTVLIVDADDVSVGLVAAGLAEAGFVTVRVGDGEAALAAFAAEPTRPGPARARPPRPARVGGLPPAPVDLGGADRGRDHGRRRARRGRRPRGGRRRLRGQAGRPAGAAGEGPGPAPPGRGAGAPGGGGVGPAGGRRPPRPVGPRGVGRRAPGRADPQGVRRAAGPPRAGGAHRLPAGRDSGGVGTGAAGGPGRPPSTPTSNGCGPSSKAAERPTAGSRPSESWATATRPKGLADRQGGAGPPAEADAGHAGHGDEAGRQQGRIGAAVGGTPARPAPRRTSRVLLAPPCRGRRPAWWPPPCRSGRGAPPGRRGPGRTAGRGR